MRMCVTKERHTFLGLLAKIKCDRERQGGKATGCFFFFGVGKRISSGDIDRLCTSSIYSNSLNDFLNYSIFFLFFFVLVYFLHIFFFFFLVNWKIH